jgi:hypothetical protein
VGRRLPQGYVRTIINTVNVVMTALFFWRFFARFP